MSKLHYIIPIFVPHEGCPHTCVFCNQDSITGSCIKIDKDFVESTVKSYLNTIERKNSIVEISFFGGTFTAIDLCKQKELLEVAKRYKDLGEINYIRLSTRPDYINDEILTNLKKYGVDIIELGVQSLDEEVLVKSGRGHTAIDVERATSKIKEYGIKVGHQIMLGLPGDNFEKDIETTRKIIEMKPSICRIYPSLVIKNTPMEKLFREGKYKPYSLEEAVKVSKKIYGMLESNDIKVIRIGLQPTEEINYNGDIIDGPFHPSFRELVESSIFSDMIIDHIKNNKYEDIIISINPRDISKLYANKKYYFKGILSTFNIESIKVIQDDTISRGFIGFHEEDKIQLVSQKEHIRKFYGDLI